MKMSRRCCVICCNSELNLVNVSNVVGDERWNDNDTIPIHFITRKLLKLSEGICEQILTLTESGNSGQENVSVATSSIQDSDNICRFELCEKCYCIVNEALDCHQKILNLEREISSLGETLVKFVHESRKTYVNRIDRGFYHLRELLSTESEQNIKEAQLIKNEVESGTDSESDDGGHEDPVPMDDSILDEDEASDGDLLNDSSDYKAKATEAEGKRNSEMETSSDERSEPGEPMKSESDADSDYVPEATRIWTKKKKSKVKPGTGPKLNCPKCKFTAWEEPRLIKHMITSHKMVKNACDTCGYFGERQSKYIKHMRNVHSISVTKWNPLLSLSAPGSSALSEKTYQCPCCDSISPNLTKFKSHEEVHRESDKLGNKFDCPVCLFPHLSQAALRRHLKKVHGDVDVACKNALPRAGIDISTEEISKRLGRTVAHGERLYFCKMCDAPFTTFITLTVHAQRHSQSQLKGNQFNCDVCRFPCSDAEALQKHKRKSHGDKNLICEKCDKAFLAHTIYLQHLEMHKREEALFDPETGLYKCPLCPFRGPFRGVNRHRTIRHVDSTEVVDEKKHLCSECGAHFKYPAQLQKHIRNKHENIFQYNCDICKKGYDVKIQYETHLKSHDKNRVCDFVCEWCGVAYLSEPSLKIHVATAHPEEAGQVPTSIQGKVRKPGNYKCKWCDMTFQYKHLLVNIHYSSMHKDKYKFKCDICGKAFSSRRSTNRHKTHVHRNDMNFDFVCEFCNKGFTLNRTLISHKKTCVARESVLSQGETSNV